MSILKPPRPLGPPACRTEPDRVIGTIQPFGILAIVSVGDLTIESISENVEALLGVSAHEICGRPLTSLLDPADAQTFCAKIREPRLAALNPHDLTLCGPDGLRLRVEATIHRREGDRTIVEFEPGGSTLERPSYGEAQAPIERLTTAAALPSLLAGAARDIRAISGFARVVVYRFERDGQCEVVAESAAPGIALTYYGKRFGAGHISESERRCHLRSPVKLVPDSQYVPTRVIATASSTPENPVDLSRAMLSAVSTERLDILKSMGSRAAFTIAIVIRGRLWGLIACHHDAPRRLSYRKRAVCELISHMLAWQLDSRIQADKLQRRTRAASLQAKIGATIDGAADIGEATIKAAPDMLDLFAADGIAVRLNGIVRRTGNAPSNDARIIEIAQRLNDRAENGVATGHEFGGGPADALFIRLAPDGGDFVLVFRAHRSPKLQSDAAARGAGVQWSGSDLNSAVTLRGRLHAQLQTRERERMQQIVLVDPYLEARNAQAAALIKLHEDVAAALPTRHAIVQIILAFAQIQTQADGSVMEVLGATDIVAEAATGMLASAAGTQVPRTGTLSDASANLHVPLLCDDSTREVESAERITLAALGIASMLVVPISLSDTATIVLKVVSQTRAAFDDEDIQTLKLAATNLVTALLAAQKFDALAAAEKEQRNYARRLRALHAIASTTTSNRKDQIDAALQLGLEQLDLDWAFLGVIDYAAHEFVIENSVSRKGEPIVDAGVRTALGETIVGRIAHTKGVRIIHDVAELDERPAFGGWASNITVPLFIGGVNYGVIGFTSREARPQPFSAPNIEFMAVAGELISSAVERGLQREKLETSETRYRALTEAIPAMVWVIDAVDRFEYVNARWTDYTGLTLEQSRGPRCEGVYDSAQLPIVNAGRSALPPKEYDCEVRLRRNDGTYRWHLVRSVPFHDSAGDAGKWLVTATDIEERKSAEAQLTGIHDAALAATEAKSRFLATMSHEIRTPMNAVIGMTELLLLTQLGEEQREYIEIVRDSGQSLLHILNDILDYSKIEAGKLALETVHFDLPGQIESVVELLRAQYQLKCVRLATTIAPGVPAIVAGDPGRLRQILLNLAGNALKFTSEGGEVHIDAVRSQARKNAIRFTISDTGIGIPADVVARLFQPFAQGDESTTRKYGGTGLGLSICAQLVALMNGTIGVQSVPGVGSTFWFEIPLRPANVSAKAHGSRKNGSAPAKPVVMRAEKILLVEDNEINTFLALKQLQRIGFIVSAVNNGRLAVEAIEHEHFDLVFMDCHMPEMDGFAATREIRRSEAGSARRLPIVAMTADARTEDHQNCLLAGMDDYISKPTSLESLRAVLDRWLPTPERRQTSRNTISGLSPAASLGIAKLLELFGGDRAAVLTLLTAAAGSIKADFARIENCAAAHDFAAVAEAAYRLKGTSATIRSTRLGDISSAVARAAQSADGALPQTLLDELRSEVESLVSDVETHGKVLATTV